MSRLLKSALSFLARVFVGRDDALERRVREIKERRELRELKKLLKDTETPRS